MIKALEARVNEIVLPKFFIALMKGEVRTLPYGKHELLWLWHRSMWLKMKIDKLIVLLEMIFHKV